MGLLAQNVVTPGAVTLLMNISMSLAHPGAEAAGGMRAKSLGLLDTPTRKHWYSRRTSDAREAPRWFREYLCGAAQELYEVDVPEKLYVRRCACGAGGATYRWPCP